MNDLEMLYEDNHLLVVVKPPMMPVQADESGDLDLLTLCKAYIGKKYAKPGAVYLGLVHRLDRPVGGVMVFARTSKAAARLQETMQKGAWKKEYLAILAPLPDAADLPDAGRLEDWIARDKQSHSSLVCREDSPEAKRAELDYRILARWNGLAMASIDLHTGRHHQIRLQFASRAWPVWGDARYNSSSRPGQDIALWAHSLSFAHPTKGEELCFSVPPPAKEPWDLFANCI